MASKKKWGYFNERGELVTFESGGDTGIVVVRASKTGRREHIRKPPRRHR